MPNLQVNMTKDPILKSLVIFALPILFSNIFQQLYNTIDIMIVGNFLGDSSLAAIGASSSIYELLLGFCFGVGNGLSIVVSRYFGQGDKTLLKKIRSRSHHHRTDPDRDPYDVFFRWAVSADARLKNTGKYSGGITFLCIHSDYFYRCYVRLQSAVRTFTWNRKQLYAADLPDYFFPDQHHAGSFIYHTVPDGHPAVLPLRQSSHRDFPLSSV